MLVDRERLKQEINEGATRLEAKDRELEDYKISVQKLEQLLRDQSDMETIDKLSNECQSLKAMLD